VYLKHNYRDLQEKYNIYLRVGGYKQHTNQEKRIASMVPLISSGWLLFNEDITPPPDIANAALSHQPRRRPRCVTRGRRTTEKKDMGQ
jgi:hypothetical protein